MLLQGVTATMHSFELYGVSLAAVSESVWSAIMLLSTSHCSPEAFKDPWLPVSCLESCLCSALVLRVDMSFSCERCAPQTTRVLYYEVRLNWCMSQDAKSLQLEARCTGCICTPSLRAAATHTLKQADQ
jgi:hypothetical protein